MTAVLISHPRLGLFINEGQFMAARFPLWSLVQREIPTYARCFGSPSEAMELLVALDAKVVQSECDFHPVAAAPGSLACLAAALEQGLPRRFVPIQVIGRTGDVLRDGSLGPGRDVSLQVILRTRESRGPILDFKGGPTGHEAFYLNDLQSFCVEGNGEFFPLCAGTHLRWPYCTVSRSELQKALDYYQDHLAQAVG